MITSNWIAKIPFVCPTSLALGEGERPLAFEVGKLKSGQMTYGVIEGVPILLPISSKTSQEAERGKFYADMYEGHSRELDLASDYLSNERKFIPGFIEKHQIKGLVLEIGCGTGMFADCSPNYLGMDYSRGSMFAPGFEQYRRFQADAQFVPLASASVELVFSFNTLEHVPDPGRAFNEIDRILAPGGYAILHPSWNCTRSQTRLIPVLPYSRLSIRDKITKFLLPVLRSAPYKAVSRFVYRSWRSFNTGSATDHPLKYTPLSPYLGSEFFIADCDATACIDIYDGIDFFVSRGYDCLSHPGMWTAMKSRHVAVIVQKPDYEARAREFDARPESADLLSLVVTKAKMLKRRLISDRH